MSKLYEKYQKLKKEKPSNLYLFKSGIFYIFLEDDAEKMSSFLNLKLTNLNETVLKCGFPINNLNKYSDLIKKGGYELQIVDSATEKVHSSADYILNNDIKNFLQKLSTINTNELSIREAYSIIEDIQKQAKEFTKDF